MNLVTERGGKPNQPNAPNYLRQRTISHAALMAFRRCKLRYRLEKEGYAPFNHFRKMVGDLTAEFTAETDEDQRESKLQGGLEVVPDADSEKVEAEVRKLGERALELEDDGAFGVQRERRYRWTDEVSGWVFYAKPDKVSFVRDERGVKILQIIDEKTADAIKKHHIDQIFFFGLVVTKALGERFTGPVKLIVRLLGAPEGEEPDNVFWFNRGRVNRSLREIRRELKEIDACLAKDRFEPSPWYSCKYCSVKEHCRAYKKWKKAHPDDGRPSKGKRVVKLAPQYGGHRVKKSRAS